MDVESILDQLDLAERPRLRVWNKADATDPDTLTALLDQYGGVPVSAQTGEGLDRLLERVERALFRSPRGPDPSRAERESWRGTKQVAS